MSGMTVIGIVLLVVYAILAHSKPGIALATVLFTAIALAAWSTVLTEQPENLLFSPVLVLITLVVAAFARRGEEPDSWARRTAMSILVILAAIVGIIGVFAAFVLIGAGFLFPLFFFLGLAVVISGLVGYGMVSRRATASLVFSTLGAGMRQNLPLPMALDCAAAERHDGGSRVLRAIAKWLVQGYPLSEAIQRGYPRCPSRFVAMVSAAQRVDQLPTAIMAIEADMRSHDDERHRFRPVHPFYPVVILGIAFFLTVGLATFVVPNYAAVLAEMSGHPLPPSTRLLMVMTDFVRVNGGYVWLVIFGTLFVGSSLAVYTRKRGRRPEKPRWLSWIGDTVKWYLPVTRWFQSNRSSLQATELLRLALAAGGTVNDAIRATLQLDTNLHFRRRLKCWLAQVEQGEPIGASARRCGLGSPLAWAFDAETGDTPAVLDMLESFYRSNYSYRANLLRFILWPCVIIALGGTVGFIVYSLFTPGVAVIKEMARLAYP
jgi:type IV pilus assembly protein PilC